MCTVEKPNSRIVLSLSVHDIGGAVAGAIVYDQAFPVSERLFDDAS